MNHLSESQLTSVYFKEADAREQEHLAQCVTCRDEYSKLAGMLDALRSIAVPERAPEWENRMWAAMAGPVNTQLARRGRPYLLRLWLAGPVFAALLAIAFFAGRFTVKHGGAGATSSRGRERVLLIALGDHLDRSQIVLAELVNSRDASHNDISAEQQMATHLIGENRLLRQTATRSGDQNSAALLDQLERVLLDVAHSPSDVSAGELDEIRQQIESQGLLFKVRIISNNVKAKGMKL